MLSICQKLVKLSVIRPSCRIFIIISFKLILSSFLSFNISVFSCHPTTRSYPASGRLINGKEKQRSKKEGEEEIITGQFDS